MKVIDNKVMPEGTVKLDASFRAMIEGEFEVYSTDKEIAKRAIQYFLAARFSQIPDTVKVESLRRVNGKYRAKASVGSTVTAFNESVEI